MNTFGYVEQTVCDLIAAALFGKELNIAEDTDWETVYREISLQSLWCLFRELTPQLTLPKEIEVKWSTQNYGILARGVQVASAQQELTRLLLENNIPHVILKGTAAAQYYPVASNRALGDVDFIVRENDYEPALKLLLQNGYLQCFAHEDNYRHECFKKDGVYFECHRKFADKSYSGAEVIDRLIAGNIENAVKVESEHGAFPALPTAVNGLVLLEHIAIHIKTGLGLRQILDFLLYAEHHLDSAGWEGENGQIIREAGLAKLAATVVRAGQMFFSSGKNAPWCSEASEDVCCEMMQLVFSYGNFGSKNTVDEKVVGVANRYRSGIFKNLKETGEHNWKTLHERPWLRPLAPLYQVFRYGRQVFTRKGALKALFKSKKAVDEREELLKNLGIQR